EKAYSFRFYPTPAQSAPQ
ncbi:helix-turn-helix domain-containing protein, partial [Microcystis sp. M046S2]